MYICDYQLEIFSFTLIHADFSVPITLIFCVRLRFQSANICVKPSFFLSLIYADIIRDHLHENYAALQLRIVLLHFFYKYCRCYAAQFVNLPFKIFSHGIFLGA
jgi:hypothetical protein